MTFRRVATVIAVCAATAGCESAIPVPTEADAVVARQRDAEVTREDLQRGRQLYVAKCAGCHQLFLPRDRPATSWPSLVADMAKRSGISEPDQRFIARYLSTMAR